MLIGAAASFQHWNYWDPDLEEHASTNTLPLLPAGPPLFLVATAIATGHWVWCVDISGVADGTMTKLLLDYRGVTSEISPQSSDPGSNSDDASWKRLAAIWPIKTRALPTWLPSEPYKSIIKALDSMCIHFFNEAYQELGHWWYSFKRYLSIWHGSKIPTVSVNHQLRTIQQICFFSVRVAPQTPDTAGGIFRWTGKITHVLPWSWSNPVDWTRLGKAHQVSVPGETNAGNRGFMGFHLAKIWMGT